MMAFLHLYLLASLTQLDDASDRRRFEDAIALHLKSDFDNAERGYRELPDFVPARLYRAQALWLRGRKDEARRELAEAGVADLLLKKWLAWRFGVGTKDAVVETLQRSYPFEQRLFLATGTASLILLSRGEVELAYEDYLRAAALDSGDVKLHRQLGSAFFDAGYALGAARAYELVVAATPESRDAWRQLGSSYLLLQRWSSAAEALERSMELGGDDPSGLMALGYALERQSEIGKARELYRKASRLSPSAALPFYRIGRACLSLHELDEAEEAFVEATERDPKMAAAYRFLGEVYLRRNDPSRTASVVRRALELDPDDFEAYYLLAQAYRRLDAYDEARAALERYTELKRERRGVPRDDTPGK